jgi:hypothetical protein
MPLLTNYCSGLDDYVWVDDTHMGVALNLGGNKFGAYLQYSTGFCKRRGTRFADINGDGSFLLAQKLIL